MTSNDNSEQVPKLQAEQLRQTIAMEFPGVKITAEFPCYTSGVSGLAFDSERTVNDQFHVIERIAFVPVLGGIVQFNLTAPRDQFPAKQIEFSRFLNSFRSEKLASKERQGRYPAVSKSHLSAAQLFIFERASCVRLFSRRST
jgi:hypothetical protein